MRVKAIVPAKVRLEAGPDAIEARDRCIQFYRLDKIETLPCRASFMRQMIAK
jgi:hypothetical protein